MTTNGNVKCWSTSSNTQMSLIWHLQNKRTTIFMNRPGRRLLLAWRVMVIDILKLSLMSLSGVPLVIKEFSCS